MESHFFQNNIKVSGVEVRTFPLGIGEAFDELTKTTGNGAGERNYYGVSSMNSEGKIIYKAVEEEKYEGEAGKYNYEKDEIEKGEYLYTTLKDWQSKTTCIKDIFHERMKDGHVIK